MDKSSKVAAATVSVICVVLIIKIGFSSVAPGNPILTSQQTAPASVATATPVVDKAPDIAELSIAPVSSRVSSASNQQVALQPEMIVTFPNSAPACITREQLQEYVTHMVKGEITKYKAMEVNPKTGDGECLMLQKGKKFKILSIEYNNPALPDIGVMEIVGATNKSAVGGWTMTLGAEPAK